MLIHDLLEGDRNKRNKMLYFRQTVDSILAKVQGKTVIVFDTETSGLSVNLPWVQVTEIAAIAFEADTGKQLGIFHKKIKLTPETKAEINVQRRNIGPNDRGSLEGPRGANIPDLFRMSRYGDKDAPREDIKKVYQGFVDFINQYNNPILLGQNAGFDMGQMFAPMKKLGIQRPQFSEVLDTMILGRTWIYPLLKAGEAAGDEEAANMLQGFNNVDKKGNVKLSFSLKNLGQAFNVSAKHWHSGISDAMQTYGIFVKMMEYLRRAKELGYDTSDEFNQQHVKMSGKAFSYGKRPAFGSTIDSDTAKGIAARGRPRFNEAGEFDPSRRNFLKRAAAGAASAAATSMIPRKALVQIASNFAETVGPNNLGVIDKLLSLNGHNSLWEMMQAYIDSGILSDALLDNERSDLYDKLGDDWEEKLGEVMEEHSLDYFEAIEKVLGYKIYATKVFDIIQKHGYDNPSDFFEDNKVQDAIGNLMSQLGRAAQIPAKDAIKQGAKAATNVLGPRATVIRSALAIIGKHFKDFIEQQVSDAGLSQTSPAPKQEPKQPPALPSPSDINDVVGIDLDRLKDLSGIKRQDNS